MTKAAAVPDAALRTLVDNHRAFLRFLTRRLGDRALAEDVLQEAFAKNLAKGSAPRDDEALIPWFYRDRARHHAEQRGRPRLPRARRSEEKAHRVMRHVRQARLRGLLVLMTGLSFQ